MKNSICLPLPTSEDSPMCRVRCFAVFQNGTRELSPYPFTLRSIRFMNEARTSETTEGLHTTTWCATLFFPEMWPPDLIAKYVNEPKPSIDSGIHLPIAARLDRERPPSRSFVVHPIGWSEIPHEPLTAKNVADMMQTTHELDQLYGYEPSWCLVMWFPGHWLPSEVDEYLRSPIYQAMLPGL